MSLKKYFTRRRIIVTLLVLLSVYWFCFRGVALRISPETTKITEPRTADGKRVDYFQALVALSDPKVPPRENGFRMVAEALGRIPFENINMNYWTEMCRKLDLDPMAPPTTTYYKKTRPLFEAANTELGVTTPLDDPARFVDLPEGTPEDSPFLWNMDRAAQDLIQTKFERMQESPWTGEEDLFMPFMELYIWDISPVLDLLGEAVRKEVYFIPMIERKIESEAGTISDILLPCIQAQREFSRDLNRRIMYFLAKGELDRAIDDTITIFRLGQHLQKENLVVTRYVGKAIQEIGFPAAVHILRDSGLTMEQVGRLMKALDDLPVKSSTADMYLAVEYMMYDTISALSGKRYAFNLFLGQSVYGEPQRKPLLDWLNYYGYDWNTVAEKAGKIYRRRIDVLNEPDPVKREKMKDELWTEMSLIDQRYKKPSSYWRMIFVSTRSKMMGERVGMDYISFAPNSFAPRQLIDYEKVIHEGDAIVHLLRLACALELYKNDEGRYPAKLDKLQGKYLQEIPGDPCTETLEPFRYRLEERDIDESGQVRYGYLLYGLGSGGKDHGGKTSLKIPGTEDLYIHSKEAYNLPIRQ